MIKGEFLWAIGGKVENKRVVGDTSVYSIKSNEWYSSENEQLAPMIHPVQGAGWTYLEDKIYCFGGKIKSHSGCCDYIQVYHITEDSWELYDPMPEPPSKQGKFYPVIDNHYVYLFGGDSPFQYHPIIRVGCIIPQEIRGMNPSKTLMKDL
jgi:hypothetical protein